MKLIIDNSPHTGSPGVLLGFYEGRRALEFGRLSEAERSAHVLDGFSRYFGERARRPAAYVEKLWAQEQWSGGCYGSYLPPGTWTTCGRAMRAPVGPLHWAGTETATAWSGYMDGAVRSGERAASKITAPAPATG